MAIQWIKRWGLELFCVMWLIFAGAFSAHAAEAKPENWVIYYGSEMPSDNFLPYDVIVFDSEDFPALRPLMNRGKTLLGYLSIGEAEDYRSDFADIKNKGLLLKENKNWPGHYMVDIRNPEWGKYLIEHKIPEILHRHFNGLMLDTADSVLDLEIQNPQKYAGMKTALLDLLAAIRMHYPEIKIMINRGFDAFPEAAQSVDMVMAESTLVDDFTDPKKFRFFPEEQYQSYVTLMNEAKKQSPHLKIYSVDYWDMKDSKTIKEIYAKQRSNGFIPYVSTVDLQNIFAEPQ